MVLFPVLLKYIGCIYTVGGLFQKQKFCYLNYPKRGNILKLMAGTEDFCQTVR
jgi:hypothetical protein